jgi:3-oxoacyl-[acyl-carrier protein] reductase
VLAGKSAVVTGAGREFGRLDAMVTNAGALRDKTLRNTTDEDFDLVVNRAASRWPSR